MSENQVLTTVNDHIGILTLNRPEVMNAFSDTIARSAPSRSSTTVCNDRSVRCIIIYRSGRAFLAPR